VRFHSRLFSLYVIVKTLNAMSSIAVTITPPIEDLEMKTDDNTTICAGEYDMQMNFS